MEQFKCERREFWPDLMDASHGIVSSAPPDPSSSSSDSGLKICTDCRTTKTPLWRAGPCGPKSLCNACGIRYRKSRRTVPALKDVGAKVRKEKREMDGGAERFGLSFKLQMLGKGLWKPRSMVQKQRRRRRSVLREEEQAAVLLMALSSGVVYA